MANPDDLISAILRGERPDWPSDATAVFLAEFHAKCDMHGVNGLLHEELHGIDWPAEVTAVVRSKAVQLAMWELRHQHLLRLTLAAFAAAGIRPLLIKGTALAYGDYADPALRTRADTDLLIAPEHKHLAHEILQSAGFRRSLAVSGEYVSYQAGYSQSQDGASHTLDVHWKISNSELLSRLFSYEELLQRAQPVPALSPHAIGPSRVDAMLIACTHRATHKVNAYFVDGRPCFDADRLIWLADIRLLADRFSANDWAAFSALSRAKGLRATCLEGLDAAARLLGLRYPDAVRVLLQEAGPPEPASAYLRASKLRQQWMDFRALDGLRARLKFTRELLFPSEAYMRGKYPGSGSTAMPWLYLRRAASGVAKRLTGHRSAA